VRYLVTGAAGFIGSHLTESLLVAGNEVVPVDAFTDYYDPARKRENAAALDVVQLDLVTAPLDPLLEGVDAVFHLAGQPGVRASFGPDFVHYATRNVQADTTTSGTETSWPPGTAYTTQQRPGRRLRPKLRKPRTWSPQ
jgi:nucleoside-diphosphate-sugar epimerase